MSRLIFFSVLSFLLGGWVAASEPEAKPPVSLQLAAQMALKHGREALQSGDAKSAVAILEEGLGKCNGQTEYLVTLRDAYSAYLKELQLTQKTDLAQVYLERLKMLDKNATLDAKPVSQPTAPSSARVTQIDEDPFQQQPKRSNAVVPASAQAPVRKSGPQSELTAAERAFSERRYSEADRLFAQAFASATDIPVENRAQWAYCKFATVVDRLQQADAPVSADTEEELTAAIKLATSDPKMDSFGRQLTEEVSRRKASKGTMPKIEIRHEAASADGWASAQSANFALKHRQNPEYAEQVLKSAEQARAAAIAKWGGEKRNWKLVCEMTIYPTAANYAKATGKPATSPGHATFEMKSGQVQKRRLDLRADEPNTITNVIPHEVSHLVIADLFDMPLPRWADEGMAVLAEPRPQIDRYLRTLHRCREERKLVPISQIMQQAEYPTDASSITVFYVESVSLVEYLVEERGPETLVAFLKDITRGGRLDESIRRHYGARSAKELQDQWLVKYFSESSAKR